MFIVVMLRNFSRVSHVWSKWKVGSVFWIGGDILMSANSIPAVINLSVAGTEDLVIGVQQILDPNESKPPAPRNRL